MIKTKKSKNFDRNLDAQQMVKQANKNIFVLASTINTIAKQKFIPIATRETYNSAELKKEGDKIILSSINQAGTRYNRKKANGNYEITNGSRYLKIPAGKNAGRYEWYDQAEPIARKKINISKEVLND